MDHLVSVEISGKFEQFVTHWARELLVLRVREHVGLEVALQGESLLANRAVERSLAGMRPLMTRHVRPGTEPLLTIGTLEALGRLGVGILPLYLPLGAQNLQVPVLRVHVVLERLVVFLVLLIEERLVTQ